MRRFLILTAALLLSLSVLGLGAWLLLSGEAGTGAMEAHHAVMMEDPSAGMPMAVEHHYETGAASDRGVLGGYRGGLGLLMLLMLSGLVALLIVVFFSEKPLQPRQGACWQCGRPVETDWTNCPFCAASLTPRQ